MMAGAMIELPFAIGKTTLVAPFVGSFEYKAVSNVYRPHAYCRQ